VTNLQRPFRIIARLDVKGPNLIKGVHLEGLRVIGAPQVYAKRYYEQGADELIYMDIVASLYGRSNLLEIVKQTAHDVFVPLTVGGGIRCLDDVTALLRAGADKVAINTAAVHRPKLIEEVSRKFGSQCMVLSIEAKRQSDETWEVYTDCGREGSGISVIEWVREAVELGVGEILLTSIDQEGTRKGFDLRLLEAVHAVSKVPVIISGGYGQSDHIIGAIEAGADAVAVADALHYDRTDMRTLHHIAQTTNVTVRTL
jgi:cyclase